MKEVFTNTLIILAVFAACALPVLLGVVILKGLKTPLGRKFFTVDGMQIYLNNEYKSYARVVAAIVLVPIALYVIVVLISSNITTIFPESRWAYAMQYDTETQYVVIEQQPHDCEFFKAPIGSKYCHFEKNVTTHTEDQSLVRKTYVYVSWNKLAD